MTNVIDKTDIFRRKRLRNAFSLVSLPSAEKQIFTEALSFLCLSSDEIQAQADKKQEIIRASLKRHLLYTEETGFSLEISDVRGSVPVDRLINGIIQLSRELGQPINCSFEISPSSMSKEVKQGGVFNIKISGTDRYMPIHEGWSRQTEVLYLKYLESPEGRRNSLRDTNGALNRMRDYLKKKLSSPHPT